MAPFFFVLLLLLVIVIVEDNAAAATFGVHRTTPVPLPAAATMHITAAYRPTALLLLLLSPSSSRRRRQEHEPTAARVITARASTDSRPSSSSSSLYAHYLTSCLESLTPVDDEETGLPMIEWLDPSTAASSWNEESSGGSTTNDSIIMRTMPLYPLPTCYLPSSSSSSNTTTTHYHLCNTEPRNIQMALDLMNMTTNKRYFCAVLRAQDSGKIANIGTVLQIVHAETQYNDSNEQEQSNIRRILLTCVSQQLVEIVRIENPDAARLEYRWKHPNEYLKATVRILPLSQPAEEVSSSTPSSVDEDRHYDRTTTGSIGRMIVQEYNAVRDLYIEQRGHGTAVDLPPYSQKAISEALPVIQGDDDLLDRNVFWNVVAQWQSLCETVREAHQISLTADRNEMLIDAAIRKGGGPLKLPVHVEELDITDRQCVEQLEMERQHAWLDLQLDPCLDVQVLLGLCSRCSDDDDRQYRLFRYFYIMVSRERQRLERRQRQQQQQQQQQQKSLEADNNGQEQQQRKQQQIIEKDEPPPRRGAWFDDDEW